MIVAPLLASAAIGASTHFLITLARCCARPRKSPLVVTQIASEALAKTLTTWHTTAPEDKKALCQLLKERVQFDASIFRFHVVVDDQNEVRAVMSSRMHADGKSLYIDYLVSSPFHKKAGAGAKLVAYAIEMARLQTPNAPCVKVAALTQAIPFFAHMGFETSDKEGRFLRGENLKGCFAKYH
jgi:N-acetylglutamate synthase-like GNAT family acetyltransferase